MVAEVVLEDNVPEGEPLVLVGALVSDSTIIVTVELDVKALSVAESLRTYVPFKENVAVVEAKAELVKVTVPGPEILLQEINRELPAGKPSSEAVPDKYAVVIGYSKVLSEPAETTGARLIGAWVVAEEGDD